MAEITWEQHLAWCKKRALACLPGDPVEAVASMVSDLRKHPEGPRAELIGALMMAIMSSPTPTGVRDWINGWN